MTKAIRKRSDSSGLASKQPSGTDASWWSVQFAADEICQLTAKRFLEDARGAKRCVLVSAYLATDWLMQLLTAVSAKCDTRLHLNAADLLRKPALRKFLTERIEHGLPAIRVWSHRRRGGIFHPKLYAFHNGRAWTIWTGSANGSTQAFEANEELMLRARGNIVSPLLQYLESLERDGEEFKSACTQLAFPDVRALLLGGRLYLRRDWLSGLRLPINVRLRPQEREQAAAPPGYVAPRGKSSFDVAAALEIKKDRNKARIKKLTLATCYGLWAPQALGEEIEVDRRRVQGHPAAMLGRVWDANKAAGESTLQERFERVLDFVTKKQWRNSAYRANWKWDPEEAFRRFYERLFGDSEEGRIGRLSPELRERMANPIYSGILPNLFDDRTDGEEFLASFFESLEVESYKAKSQNRIWNTIREFCKLEHLPYTADHIRIHLEAFLNVIPFDDNRWKGGDVESESSDDDAEDDSAEDEE